MSYTQVKLGKKEAKKDPRTLRLARYTEALPAPPPITDWLSGITGWGMMKNDSLGDCTCAAIGHACQVWSAATGPIFTASDEQVVQLYEQACGYDPSNPSTDQGGVELDVLNFWRKNGFAGNQLVAYADPDPGNIEHVKQSIYLFGGVYIGLTLPISAQNQTVWDVVGNPQSDWASRPGSWGGHAVFVPYYDESGLVCITWGAQQRMTWNFWRTYCDESHTLLSKMWLDRAPSDFHLGDLQSDLALVTQ